MKSRFTLKNMRVMSNIIAMNFSIPVNRRDRRVPVNSFPIPFIYNCHISGI